MRKSRPIFVGGYNPQLFIKRNQSSIRQLTKDYGMLAISVYSVLSFSTFCCCLYSVTYMGITQEDVSKIGNRIKEAVGMKISNEPQTESTVWKSMPAWIKTPRNAQIMTNVLIAMGMTKLFSPIKIGITAAIVPGLGRRLKAKGWIK